MNSTLADYNTINNNYNITFVPGILTIVKSNSIVVSATSYNGIYNGTENDALSDIKVYDPVLNKEIIPTSVKYCISNCDDSNNFVKEMPKIKNAGNYQIYVEVATKDYTTNTSSFVATIKQDAITINVKNATRLYEADKPLFGFTIVGQVYDNLDNYIKLSTAATTSSNIGQYIINANITANNVTDNYQITINPGTLTITQSNMVKIISEAYNGIYDGNEHKAITKIKIYDLVSNNYVEPTSVKYCVLNCTNDGFATTNVSAYSDIIPEIINAGSYQIYMIVESKNYSTQCVSTYATIAKAPAYVTINDQQRMYQSKDPKFTYSILGEIDNQLNDQLVIQTTAVEDSNVGQYPIIASYLSNEITNNYNIQITNGILTIVKSDSISVVVNGLNTEYNAKKHDAITDIKVTNTISNKDIIQYDISYCEGICNDQDIYDQTMPTYQDAGIYPFTVKVVTQDFETRYVQAYAIIDKDQITIKAKDVVRSYNQNNPKFSININGDVYDNIASLVTYDTNALKSSNVGTYFIQPILNKSPILNNYNIDIEVGILTITPSEHYSIKANSYNGVYDNQNHEAISSIKIINDFNNQPLDNATIGYCVLNCNEPMNYTNEIPLVKDAGNYKVAIKVEANNFQTKIIYQDITITKADITIKVNNASKMQGSDNPTFSSNILGFDNGQISNNIVYTTSATKDSVSGQYPIKASVKDQNVLKNYNIKYIDGTLTVEKESLMQVDQQNSQKNIVKTDDQSNIGLNIFMLIIIVLGICVLKSNSKLNR